PGAARRAPSASSPTRATSCHGGTRSRTGRAHGTAPRDRGPASRSRSGEARARHAERRTGFGAGRPRVPTLPAHEPGAGALAANRPPALQAPGALAALIRWVQLVHDGHVQPPLGQRLQVLVRRLLGVEAQGGHRASCDPRGGMAYNSAALSQYSWTVAGSIVAP